MARLLLTDDEWELIADVFPGPAATGRPRRDARMVFIAADQSLLDEDGERIAWPFALGGDKGDRADGIDEYLLDLGITPVIPSKENEDRDARPVEFDQEMYRSRNVVERLIGWLKERRRIFSRSEKTAKNFGGLLTLAFIRQDLQYELV